MGKIVVASMKFRDGGHVSLLWAYDGNATFEHGIHLPDKKKTKRVQDPEAWLKDQLRINETVTNHHMKVDVVVVSTELREYSFTPSLYRQLVRDLF